MKRFLILLILIVLAAPALSQTAPVRFKWTQPATTMSGQATQDGWMQKYNVYVAAAGDTILYAVVEAPHAVADSAQVTIDVAFGVPMAVQVEGVDIWDQVGPIRSIWSDTHIVIPEPPAEPGKPTSQ